MAYGVSNKDRRGGIAIQTDLGVGIEAVAFDLDSTLCFYPLSVEEVLRESLRRTGVPPEVVGELASAATRYAQLWSDLQATLEATERIRLHIIEQLLRERGTDDSGCAKRLSDAYGAVRSETGVRPFGGVVPLLRDLKQRYALGLLTNGPSDMQWEKVRSLGLAGLFDAIVVAGDLTIYKPDARAFEALADRLGVRGNAVLFVGDSYELDIVGAHRAGMRTAWIRHEGKAPTGDVLPDFETAGTASLREVLL